MSQTGTVLEILNDDLKISMIRNEACAKCRACIQGMTEKEMILTAKNLCGAKKGDIVEIELNEGVFLFAVLIMYGIPGVMMLTGFFIGSMIFSSINSAETGLFSFAAGIFLMILSYIIVSKNSRLFENKKYEPIATKVVE